VVGKIDQCVACNTVYLKIKLMMSSKEIVNYLALKPIGAFQESMEGVSSISVDVLL